MTRITRKSTIVVALLLVFASGSAAGLYVYQRQKQQHKTPSGYSLDYPDGRKYTYRPPKNPPPDHTVDFDDIVSSGAKYAGKQVTVLGHIRKQKYGYALTQFTGRTIGLDFSKSSINPDDYLASPSAPFVTGRVVHNNDSNYIIVVGSVRQ